MGRKTSYCRKTCTSRTFSQLTAVQLHDDIPTILKELLSRNHDGLLGVAGPEDELSTIGNSAKAVENLGLQILKKREKVNDSQPSI